MYNSSESGIFETDLIQEWDSVGETKYSTQKQNITASAIPNQVDNLFKKEIKDPESKVEEISDTLVNRALNSSEGRAENSKVPEEEQKDINLSQQSLPGESIEKQEALANEHRNSIEEAAKNVEEASEKQKEETFQGKPEAVEEEAEELHKDTEDIKEDLEAKTEDFIEDKEETVDQEPGEIRDQTEELSEKLEDTQDNLEEEVKNTESGVDEIADKSVTSLQDKKEELKEEFANTNEEISDEVEKKQEDLDQAVKDTEKLSEEETKYSRIKEKIPSVPFPRQKSIDKESSSRAGSSGSQKSITLSVVSGNKVEIIGKEETQETVAHRDQADLEATVFNTEEADEMTNQDDAISATASRKSSVKSVQGSIKSNPEETEQITSQNGSRKNSVKSAQGSVKSNMEEQAEQMASQNGSRKNSVKSAQGSVKSNMEEEAEKVGSQTGSRKSSSKSVGQRSARSNEPEQQRSEVQSRRSSAAKSFKDEQQEEASRQSSRKGSGTGERGSGSKGSSRAQSRRSIKNSIEEQDQDGGDNVKDGQDPDQEEKDGQDKDGNEEDKDAYEEDFDEDDAHEQEEEEAKEEAEQREEVGRSSGRSSRAKSRPDSHKSRPDSHMQQSDEVDAEEAKPESAKSRALSEGRGKEAAERAEQEAAEEQQADQDESVPATAPARMEQVAPHSGIVYKKSKYKKVRKKVPPYLQNIRSTLHTTFTQNANYNREKDGSLATFYEKSPPRAPPKSPPKAPKSRSRREDNANSMKKSQSLPRLTNNEQRKNRLKHVKSKIGSLPPADENNRNTIHTKKFDWQSGLRGSDKPDGRKWVASRGGGGLSNRADANEKKKAKSKSKERHSRKKDHQIKKERRKKKEKEKEEVKPEVPPTSLPASPPHNEEPEQEHKHDVQEQGAGQEEEPQKETEDSVDGQEQVEEANGEESHPIPDELVDEEEEKETLAPKEVKRVDYDSVEMILNGRSVPLRIPTIYRDIWSADESFSAPDDVNYDLEWVYGYRGRDCGNNMYILPTGEIAYFIAAVVVLYNPDSDSQRHYTRHTNDVECLAIHASEPLCASGQAKGHDEGGKVQKAHVQVWNFDSLNLVAVVGLDTFRGGISLVSFASGISPVTLAVLEGQEKPIVTLWEQNDDTFDEVHKQVVSDGPVHSMKFVPGDKNKFITTGRSEVTIWTRNEDDGLNSEKGIFTRKLPVPENILCLAFAENGDFLTGDSDGNLMIWNDKKVSRVLKGAHDKDVGGICVSDNGEIVSCGFNDGALVVFDKEYQLIGAGANLAEHQGKFRMVQIRNHTNENGTHNFKLVVGTTANCIMEMAFKVEPNSNVISNVETEVFIEGHSSSVNDIAVVPNQDQFVSCGGGGKFYLWDAIAHKSMWQYQHNASVTCVAVNDDGTHLAMGNELGQAYWTETEQKQWRLCIDVEGPINLLAFSPNGDYLALAAQDHGIHILGFKDDTYSLSFYMSGHSSKVTHLDWSLDSVYLRSNSSDYELLHWSTETEQLLTDTQEIDSIGIWNSHTVTVSFETIGIWPLRADGTDVNSCDALDHVVVAGDDFGLVRLFKFPAVQPQAESIDLHGHSAHVTSVAFMAGGSRLISGGGREASILQWIN